MILEKNDRILFDGDSITDAKRDRSDEFSLSGYNKIVMDTINSFQPSLNIVGYNRGNGGDTSTQLLARFEADILEVKPTVITLLVGVNDTWRLFDANKTFTSVEKFTSNITKLLELAYKYVKKVVLLEPFMLTTDNNKNCWRDDLNPKIIALREVAMKFKPIFIPLDGIFAEASIRDCSAKYSLDSVHPTIDGHALIAKHVLSKLL